MFKSSATVAKMPFWALSNPLHSLTELLLVYSRDKVMVTPEHQLRDAGCHEIEAHLLQVSSLAIREKALIGGQPSL